MSDRKLFVHRKIVRWGDTDAARIVYTGRFGDFVLEAIEAWVTEMLGTNWFVMNVDDKIGTPFVNLTLDFRSPVTPREALDLSVQVIRAGRSSVTWRVLGTGAESRELRFEALATSVFVDHVAMKSVPAPDKWRAVLDRELVSSESKPA